MDEIEHLASKPEDEESKEKARLLKEYWSAQANAPKHLVGVGIISFAEKVLEWLQGEPQEGDFVEVVDNPILKGTVRSFLDGKLYVEFVGMKGPYMFLPGDVRRAVVYD